MRSQRSHFNVRHMYPSLISFNPTSNFLSCEKQHFYLFCLSVNILFCLIRLVQLDNASKCAAAVAVVMMIADDSGGWTVAIRNKDRFVLPFSAYHHQFSSSLSSMSKKKGERICDSSASDRSAAALSAGGCQDQQTATFQTRTVNLYLTSLIRLRDMQLDAIFRTLYLFYFMSNF